MARPIEPTPTLKKKDAERFYRSLEEAVYSPEKARMLEEADRVYSEVQERMPSPFSDRKSLA